MYQVFLDNVYPGMCFSSVQYFQYSNILCSHYKEFVKMIIIFTTLYQYNNDLLSKDFGRFGARHRLFSSLIGKNILNWEIDNETISNEW